MKLHSVLSHLTVLAVFSILFASIIGCEKKEDQSSAENETSSEPTMKPSQPEFIAIGRILTPWGIEGKLKVEVITEFPQRFTPGAKVYVNQQPMTVDSIEWHKGRAILKLSTIDGIKEAEKLRGQLIEIDNSQLYTLPEGQYYGFQLIGLEDEKVNLETAFMRLTKGLVH